jgi:hypothetical protein
MSVKKQLDWEFECDISGCSLNEKVYYTKWHQDDPSLSFLEMLRLQAEMREESEKEEWERHMADEAYYAEEEKRLLAAEAERLEQEQEEEEEESASTKNTSNRLATIEESEEEE